MSLSREIAIRVTDPSWIDEAFGQVLDNLTQHATMRNRRSLDNWYRIHIDRPLHKGGMSKETLQDLRRTFRHLASSRLKADERMKI
jgi:hypothetical protein